MGGLVMDYLGVAKAKVRARAMLTKKEFWTHKIETRTEHIRHITIRGDHNNNKMERMNGEVRDREKTMRGLKKKDTPILKGYQIFHNYIRPHEALDGKTPAEACGIKIEGKTSG